LISGVNVKNRFRRIIYVIYETAMTLIAIFIPKYFLVKKAKTIIKDKLYPWADGIEFYLSGRSALADVFNAISERKIGDTVLIPDYVCNILHRTITTEGLAVETYHVDENLLLSLDEIEDKVKNSNISAIVLASIFGSQNNGTDILSRIRQINEDVIIILDECQNVILDNHIELIDKCLVVNSFNHKNIQGLMGGCVCYTDNFLNLNSSKATFRTIVRSEVLMVAIFMIRNLRNLMQAIGLLIENRMKYSDPKLEYSFCERFPYRVDIEPITKISLCSAIREMLHIQNTEDKRKRNYLFFTHMVVREDIGELITTERADVSPYIPIRLSDEKAFGKLPLKGPYAFENDQNSTAHPNIFSIMNDCHITFDEFEEKHREKKDCH